MSAPSQGPTSVAEPSAAELSPAIVITDVSRSFGPVKALSNATLTIGKGERLGLIGHNGAGKSTLMNVLSGVFPPDQGEMVIAGERCAALTPRRAYELGIRTIFQELSLCPNLTAIENTLVRHPELAGWGWRGRARALISASLDRIFPGHGIHIGRELGSLTIAQRQMVEIAEAFAETASIVRLVILDEPTSSLDSRAAEQLMAFLKVAAKAGIATILISHRLQEILGHTDRVVVMVDGRIVGASPAASLTRQSLVALMGHLEAAPGTQDARSSTASAAAGQPDDPLRLVVRQGEIVGFAGLDGHGQRATLQYIYNQASRGRDGLTRGSAAYVPGDRQVEGIFSVWSVAENATIRSLRDLTRHGLIDLARERSLAAEWLKRIGVRSAGADAGITTLSGGNQQKVLFARSLASKASLILLDDPMRGVDVGTKSDVYALIRGEARNGRSFVWYSTETDELRNCDRVYVFKSNQIVAVLDAGEINEENILKASFTEPMKKEDIDA